jgi:hypothetical protein
MGEDQDLTATALTLAGDVVGEAGQAVHAARSGQAQYQLGQKVLREESERMTHSLSSTFKAKTSYGTVQSADDMLDLFSGTHPAQTKAYRQASDTYGASEKALIEQSHFAYSTLPEAKRGHATRQLYEAAGMEMGAQYVPADSLLKRALQMKKELYQEAMSLEGTEKAKAMALHQAQADKINRALEALDPDPQAPGSLTSQYKDMRAAYQRDLTVNEYMNAGMNRKGKGAKGPIVQTEGGSKINPEAMTDHTKRWVGDLALHDATDVITSVFPRQMDYGTPDVKRIVVPYTRGTIETPAFVKQAPGAIVKTPSGQPGAVDIATVQALNALLEQSSLLPMEQR